MTNGRVAILLFFFFSTLVAGHGVVGCGGEESAPEIDQPPAPDGAAPPSEGGGRSGETTDAAPSTNNDATASSDANGSGCPKTSCEAYATSTAACSDKGYAAWKDVCDNAAKKCSGPNLPNCFCSSDCDTRRYCFLVPCEQ